MAAWRLPGGHGRAVRVADVEAAWIENHEALDGAEVTFPWGTVKSQEERNHGASVLGMLAAPHGYRGINGLCPEATVIAVSMAGEESRTDDATFEAAKRLAPGDVLLIELERRTGADDKTSVGYLPVEWWSDEFDLIKWATGQGIIVVEAAGNGSADLDRPPEPDPARASQPNPFLRRERDSGSIIVGAGAPPSAWGDPPDRARLSFSNYGTCVDAQGWGAAVATAGGYGDGRGDLVGGDDERRWYTARFNGTSSAAPMVAGALACVQGILKACGPRPLTPLEARHALRQTGTPQTASFVAPLEQRIGNRPDLEQLIPYAMALANGAPDELRPRPRRRGMQITITLDRRGVHVARGPQSGLPPDTGSGLSQVRMPSVDLPHVKGPTLALLDDAGTLQTIGSLDEFADKIASRIRGDVGEGTPASKRSPEPRPESGPTQASSA
jgi:hypothetical protein